MRIKSHSHIWNSHTRTHRYQIRSHRFRLHHFYCHLFGLRAGLVFVSVVFLLVAKTTRFHWSVSNEIVSMMHATNKLSLFSSIFDLYPRIQYCDDCILAILNSVFHLSFAMQPGRSENRVAMGKYQHRTERYVKELKCSIHSKGSVYLYWFSCDYSH